MEDPVKWLGLIATVVGTAVMVINAATIFILSSIARRLERLEDFILNNADGFFHDKERRLHAR